MGQGIIKALRISELPIKIIGADISTMNAALYRTDESILIPKVEDEGALEKLIKILQENCIQVVMIGSEYELEFFSLNKSLIEHQTGVLVIISPIETINIANDKWFTAEFLRKNNLPYAESYLPKISPCNVLRLTKEWGLPIVLKTRRGTSSRYVHIVKDIESMKRYFHDLPLPMLQRMISLPSSELNSEYTCSIFKTLQGDILGPFTARRTLREASWHVEMAEFKGFIKF